MRIPAQRELDRLCGRADRRAAEGWHDRASWRASLPWRVIGVSALVYDANHAYLEITKPHHWFDTPDGQTVVTLAGIGGRLNPGEGLLDCLEREAAEELGVPLQVVSAAGTRLIFEGVLQSGLHTDGDKPLPWLYTVGQNEEPDSLPGVAFAVIVTYLAEAKGDPAPQDLLGLLAVPRARLREALRPQPVPLDALCRQVGAVLKLNGSLPEGALAKPILTAESVRLLLEAGLSYL